MGRQEEELEEAGQGKRKVSGESAPDTVTPADNLSMKKMKESRWSISESFGKS